MAPSASSASQVNHKPLSIQQAGCRLERTLLGPPSMHHAHRIHTEQTKEWRPRARVGGGPACTFTDLVRRSWSTLVHALPPSS